MHLAFPLYTRYVCLHCLPRPVPSLAPELAPGLTPPCSCLDSPSPHRPTLLVPPLSRLLVRCDDTLTTSSFDARAHRSERPYAYTLLNVTFVTTFDALQEDPSVTRGICPVLHYYNVHALSTKPAPSAREEPPLDSSIGWVLDGRNIASQEGRNYSQYVELSCTSQRRVNPNPNPCHPRRDRAKSYGDARWHP